MKNHSPALKYHLNLYSAVIEHLSIFVEYNQFCQVTYPYVCRYCKLWVC